MGETLHAAAGELSADEIIRALDDGRRVVLKTELLGSEYTVTLRHDGSTYYCDTPTTLHKHDDQAGMRHCIEEQGYIDVEGLED